MKGGKLFIGGISLGSTKYHKKICTSSGILRNNSTQALPNRTSHGLSGKVRRVPTIEPTTNASSSALSETDTVQPHACSIHCR